MQDVNTGVIQAGSQLYQLKALQDISRANEVCCNGDEITCQRVLLQYLQLARSLSGYGSISMPACPSDSRKNGENVVLHISYACIELLAANDEGELEVRSV